MEMTFKPSGGIYEPWTLKNDRITIGRKKTYEILIRDIVEIEKSENKVRITVSIITVSGKNVVLGAEFSEAEKVEEAVNYILEKNPQCSLRHEIEELEEQSSPTEDEPSLMITTGLGFSGYDIEEYLGIYSGQSALGTGWFSSMEAGVSDLFGVNSESYSNKIDMAREMAVKGLENNVRKAGGNAVIGVNIDIVSFSSDIIGVIAYGTAVKIVKMSEKELLTIDGGA